MTRANAEQMKYTPWYAKARAACSIVPISRFVNDRIFALKGGGYGCLFSLTGIDEEGLTDQQLEAHARNVRLQFTEERAVHESGHGCFRERTAGLPRENSRIPPY
jgi:hypothetical protein